MATLADINDTLVTQGKTLETVGDGIDSMKTALVGYLKAVKGEKLDKLEESREGGGISRMKAVAGGAIASTRDAASGLTDKIKGGLGGIGSLLTGGGLAGLGALLGKQLLKRGLPAAVLTVFADELADFILGPEADAELRKQLTQAFEFAGFGLLLGRRFAVLGAALGFLMDDDMKATLKELQEEINWDEIGTSIRENVKEGLTGITQFIKGLKLFFGEGDFSGLEEWAEGGNVLETLGVIAAIGFALSPRGTLGLLLKGPKMALWLGGKGIKGVGWALGKMGLLASVIADTGVEFDKAANRYRNTKTGRFVAGPLGFGGWIGTVLGASTMILAVTAIGAATTQWFMTTDLYKSWKKSNDEFVKKYGLEGQTASDIAAEAGATTEQLTGKKEVLGGQEDAEISKLKVQIENLRSGRTKPGLFSSVESEVEALQARIAKLQEQKRVMAEYKLSGARANRGNADYGQFSRAQINAKTNAEIIERERVSSAEAFRANEARMSGGNMIGNSVNSGNTSVQSSQAITMPPANVNNTIDTSDLMLVSP